MKNLEYGYSLVEMLVALTVTSIVLSGTYAAYVLFAKQQQTLLAQTESERNLLVAIDLMQSDIRMAGFKDINDVNVMQSAQPININSNNDVSFVYDDYITSLSSPVRLLVRYHTAQYKDRYRLYREVRKCNNPSVLCISSIPSSTSIIGIDGGEPLLDWVTNFEVTGLDKKSFGTFSDQPQTVKVKIELKTPKIIDGTLKEIYKSVTFLGRAKNISLVP